MKLKYSLLALGMISYGAISAEPAPDEETPEFTLSAELGALLKTGNTESGDIKFGTEARYEKDAWRLSASFDLLARQAEQTVDGKKRTETTDQKWELASQANYTISQKSPNYIYGSASYKDDRFSGFDSQSIASIGWGRRWYKTKKASFHADIGPGYKSDVITETDTQPRETRNAFIIQSQGLYLRKINDFVEFRQLVKVAYAPESGENSRFKSESSISTKLIETLQLKVSLNIDHNTDVEPGKDNTDTQTAVTLVYSF